MRKRTIVVAGLAVALLAIGSLVRAGTKATGRVSITPGTLATGSLGDARASLDGNQYIGCIVQGVPGPGWFTNCLARDAAGNTLSCQSFDPTIAQAAQAVSSMSAITFNVSGINCTSVLVGNSSYNRPMTP